MDCYNIELMVILLNQGQILTYFKKCNNSCNHREDCEWYHTKRLYLYLTINLKWLHQIMHRYRTRRTDFLLFDKKKLCLSPPLSCASLFLHFSPSFFLSLSLSLSLHFTLSFSPILNFSSLFLSPFLFLSFSLSSFLSLSFSLSFYLSLPLPFSLWPSPPLSFFFFPIGKEASHRRSEVHAVGIHRCSSRFRMIIFFF